MTRHLSSENVRTCYDRNAAVEWDRLARHRMEFMEAASFATLGLIGCEGVVAGHEEKVNALQGEAWELWVDLNYRLGQGPVLRGAADHPLYIGCNASTRSGNQVSSTGPGKERKDNHHKPIVAGLHFRGD